MVAERDGDDVESGECCEVRRGGISVGFLDLQFWQGCRDDAI